MARTDLDLTVVLTFADDEELVGKGCRRVADHLRELGLAFEILAVDEDSRDNSRAVLALLREDVPELRLLGAPVRDGGFAIGAHHGRGKVLWMLDAATAAAPLAAFSRAYRIVARGQADAVVVKHRFVVCYRSRCAPVAEGIRGRGVQFQTRFARRARGHKLEVELQELGAGASRAPARPWSKLLDVLSAARATWSA
jgi:hypothetical protein